MNKLSYGLLSLLSTEPLTGYDLMLKLNLFWPSAHSAIYPLLSQLEENEYIEFTSIPQSGKPDKKLYNVTSKGIDALKKWIVSETSDAVVRDEMMLKTYCIHLLDSSTVMSFINELEGKYEKKLNKNLKALEKLRLQFSDTLTSPYSEKFGVYLLIQKGLSEARLYLKWCKWIRTLYNKNSEIDLSIESFEEFLK